MRIGRSVLLCSVCHGTEKERLGILSPDHMVDVGDAFGDAGARAPCNRARCVPPADFGSPLGKPMRIHTSFKPPAACNGQQEAPLSKQRAHVHRVLVALDDNAFGAPPRQRDHLGVTRQNLRDEAT